MTLGDAATVILSYASGLTGALCDAIAWDAEDSWDDAPRLRYASPPHLGRSAPGFVQWGTREFALGAWRAGFDFRGAKVPTSLEWVRAPSGHEIDGDAALLVWAVVKGYVENPSLDWQSCPAISPPPPP